MMKDNNRQDKIRQVDFKSAFPETPSIIHEAVLKARADIIRYERRRRFIKSVATAAAACLVVVAGAAAFFARNSGNNSDMIVPPVLTQQEMRIDRETPVFACKSDPYYHKTVDCESAYAESVELPLITAVEFEKAACPICASDLVLDGQKTVLPENSVNQKTEAESLQPVIYKSDGAGKAFQELVQSGSQPDFEYEFFGGVLKVYDNMDGSYIAGTDPTPDDAIFRYVLIGRKEMDAEAYYSLNEGPGVYADYDESEKCLVASWGDTYYTHTYYSAAVETDVIDETGMCAWRMSNELFELFMRDEGFSMDNDVDNMPGLQAALW